MFGIGQPVDDRDAGGAGQLDDVLVEVGPGDDAVDHPAQHAGGVGDFLPLAQADLLIGEIQGVAAELLHSDFERDARPERGLLEDQGQDPTPERAGARVALGFQLGRQVEDLGDIVRREVGDANEIFAEHSAPFESGPAVDLCFEYMAARGARTRTGTEA